ncbi:hypothetical protein GCM10027519_38190 [Kineococcus endophyticus]
MDPVAAIMRNWDERVADHVVAHDAEAFADDPSAVGVEVEAEVLAPHLPGGSLDGLDVVHLQCHIGTDTTSLARRGARVVGTDLSGEAVATARRLAARAGLPDASFVQTANEDAPDVLGRQFDVVLTSVGVFTWLADLRRGRGRWRVSCDRVGCSSSTTSTRRRVLCSTTGTTTSWSSVSRTSPVVVRAGSTTGPPTRATPGCRTPSRTSGRTTSVRC